ncbi:hypothetical protein QBC44DRAFT_372585 [Cladorrhinum sp. PSN332]|nr:hypothetical protein QBC44DRAFT_372585 [Cladorrhinum sp. PSN332]
MGNVNSFIDQARLSGAAVGHIENHDDGQVGILLRQVWENRVKNDESVSMICLHSTTQQRSLLSLHKDLATAANDPDLRTRLKALPFCDAITESVLEIEDSSSAKLIVCMELEPVPSARGQFLLASLGSLVRQFKENHSGAGFFAVVTIGMSSHRWFTCMPSDTDVTLFGAGSPATLPPLRQIQLTEASLGTFALQICADAGRFLQTEKQRLYTIACFLPAQEWVDFRRNILMMLQAFYICPNPHKGCRLVEVNATKLHSKDNILELDVAQTDELKIAILWVEAHITTIIDIKGIESVNLVLYSPFCQEFQLDYKSGVTGMKRVLGVRPAHLEVHRRWMSPARAANPGLIEAIFETPPGLQLVSASHAYSSELYLMAFLAYSRWPGVRESNLPLAKDDYTGHYDELKWKEARLRLRAMGLVEPCERVGCRLSEMGKRALGWLNKSPEITLQIACLLAHIEPTTDEIAKRVMLRLSAVIIANLRVSLQRKSQYSLPDWFQTKKRVMAEIRHRARGHAKASTVHGHVWVHVSILERAIEFHGNLSGSMDNDSWLDDCILVYGVKAAFQWLQKLETWQGISPVTQPLAQTDNLPQLSQDEGVVLCDQALADAFLTNLMWVPQNWDPEDIRKSAVLLAHADRVNISVGELFYPQVYPQGGLLGFATCIVIERNGFLAQFDAQNFGILDARVMKTIMKRTGAGSFLQAVSSVYAHRGWIQD